MRGHQRQQKINHFSLSLALSHADYLSLLLSHSLSPFLMKRWLSLWPRNNSKSFSLKVTQFRCHKIFFPKNLIFSQSLSQPFWSRQKDSGAVTTFSLSRYLFLSHTPYRCLTTFTSLYILSISISMISCSPTLSFTIPSISISIYLLSIFLSVSL